MIVLLTVLTVAEIIRATTATAAAVRCSAPGVLSTGGSKRWAGKHPHRVGSRAGRGLDRR